MFKLTKRMLGVAAIVAALSAAPASYARVDPPLTPRQQHQIETYQRAVTKSFGPTPGGLAGPVLPVTPGSRRHAVGREASSQRGFQWDDAGIGAGIMLMLLAIGASAVTVIIRRHSHQTPLD